MKFTTGQKYKIFMDSTCSESEFEGTIISDHSDCIYLMDENKLNPIISKNKICYFYQIDDELDTPAE